MKHQIVLVKSLSTERDVGETVHHCSEQMTSMVCTLGMGYFRQLSIALGLDTDCSQNYGFDDENHQNKNCYKNGNYHGVACLDCCWVLVSHTSTGSTSFPVL